MNEYFRELRILSQNIDSGIKKLEKTWESPHLFMSGYGDNPEEAGPYVERFLSDIKDIQDQLIADQEPRAKYLADLEENIKTVETFYEQMKQNCEDVETLLSDWGYKPIPDNSETNLTTDESQADSSLLMTEEMPDILSPCTDSRGKENIDTYFTPNVKTNGPKSIATPVIKSLASVMQPTQGNRSNIASANIYPSKDFLSPYYGKRIN